ncbi:MAG TPA: hypothetical protein VLC52_01435, partial [Anaerolineae bacterium]|nr:hypothetical protein [Anaerolineae bacterium]
MVHGRMTRALALALVAALLVAAVVVPAAVAQDYRFRVPENEVHLFINPDGTVVITYDITFAPDPGSDPIDVVDIGMPNDNYSNVSASVDGVSLDTPFPSPYVDPGVAVELDGQSIQPGDTGTVHVEATVGNLLYQDTDDPEYASIEFSPTWFDSDFVYGATRLEVNFHFPPGVSSEEPRYHEVEFTEARVEDGQVVYTWIREDASASEQYVYGASFPKRVLPEGVVQAAPAFGINIDFAACCNSPLIWLLLFGGGWALLAALGARSQKRRKMHYLPPSLAVEGTGIKRGLTAIEAAVLLEAPLNRVVTMILFGLVKKGVVAVESEKPLKLRVLREESPDLKLWYYERRFVKAIEADGKLDEPELRDMIIDLIGDVNKKLTGFDRSDTKAYYKDIAARAWQQVEAADTPEVLGQRWSEGLEWTMLQDDWDDRTRTVFRDRPVVLPCWWWFYRPWAASAGPARPAGPVSSPLGGGTPVTLPTLPGGDFANTVVTGIENAANTVVSSVESFT